MGKLNDKAIQAATAKDKPYKLSDGGGLFLYVTPSGGKLWRMKYRHGGKEKLLSFGEYPIIRLKDARNHCEDARRLLANGNDPGEEKREKKAAIKTANANSFEAVAREWFAKWKAGKADNHASRIMQRLEKDVFPWIGSIPIASIKAAQLLSVLRRIEERGAIETAHRTLQNCGQVFRYAWQPAGRSATPAPIFAAHCPR